MLDSVIQDLDCFEEHFDLEAAESVAEAKSIIKETEQEGEKLALILCDHIMPEQTGISFLIELNDNASTQTARKVLLTGPSRIGRHSRSCESLQPAFLHCQTLARGQLTRCHQKTTYPIYDREQC